MDTNTERHQACKKYGLDVMYAESSSNGYACWTDSDGDQVELPSFASLEGLQAWAKKHRYGIVYVE